MFPLFLRSEHHSVGESARASDDGLQPVARLPRDSPLTLAFIEAAMDLGVPPTGDFVPRAGRVESAARARDESPRRPAAVALNQEPEVPTSGSAARGLVLRGLVFVSDQVSWNAHRELLGGGLAG